MFYRARIPLLTALVVLVVTAVAVSMVRGKISAAVETQIRANVARAQAAFPSLDLLRGIDLVNETNGLAHEPEFGDVFTKGATDAIRQAAFVALQARQARLETKERKADLMAVLGPTGKVVSRDLNINALYDEDWKAKYPAVAKALGGAAVKDVWDFDGRMTQVALAPIRSKTTGQIAGVLVMGYAATSKDATSDRERVGAEVAYFLDGKVHASSMRKAGGESAKEKALAGQLFEGRKLADPAMAGEMTKPFEVTIDGERYLGAAGPLNGNATKTKSGFVVLASISAAEEPFANVVTWVLLVGLFGALLSVVAAVLSAMRFLGPLDSVERGVADVINGARDITFESPSPDFEGLANGLNVMMARLLGRPDPTDDDIPPEASESASSSAGTPAPSRGNEMAVDPVVTGQHTSPENAALAIEPEDQYLRRIFQEYVDARTKSGEGVDASLTYESFVQKLRGNEAQLKKKYNSKAVRFKVVVKNGQTTLKPVPIN